MIKQNALLHFASELVNRPILSQLIRSHAVDVNILQASITPEEDGMMYVQFEGEGDRVEEALAFLEREGVRLTRPEHALLWDDARCTHCGACVAQCLPKALAVDAATYEVRFDEGKCIACELCVAACPFGALKSASEHLS